uniref:Uncharacterized protein n=1 Tax=Oryza glumipatula TaxID=40148 RepID=A0A0E0BTS2_9ORYZ
MPTTPLRVPSSEPSRDGRGAVVLLHPCERRRRQVLHCCSVRRHLRRCSRFQNVHHQASQGAKYGDTCSDELPSKQCRGLGQALQQQRYC